MMTTLRVVATLSSWVPSPRACLDETGGPRDAENGPELREVSDLEVGRLDVRGQLGRVAIDPRGGHAHRPGPEHVDVGPVPHEQGLGRAEVHPSEGGLEDDRLGLAPPDLVGDDDGLEERGEALALEDGPAGRRVVEVRHHREAIVPPQLGQERHVMGRALHHLGQLPHVGGEQGVARLGGHPASVEPEPAEEHAESLRRADLAVILRADALGLLPAPEQRGHERRERHVGGEAAELGVEVAGGTADRLAVDLDLGQPLPVEEHQRVEEVEEHRAVLHSSGFRWAKPSSIPCQNSTAASPYFQHRLTTRSRCSPGPRPGKSTRPVSRSLITPPRTWISWMTWRTSMPRPSRRSARAFRSRSCRATAWRYRSMPVSSSSVSRGIRRLTSSGVKRRSLTEPPRTPRGLPWARARPG